MNWGELHVHVTVIPVVLTLSLSLSLSHSFSSLFSLVLRKPQIFLKVSSRVSRQGEMFIWSQIQVRLFNTLYWSSQLIILYQNRCFVYRALTTWWRYEWRCCHHHWSEWQSPHQKWARGAEKIKTTKAATNAHVQHLPPGHWRQW